MTNKYVNELHLNRQALIMVAVREELEKDGLDTMDTLHKAHTSKVSDLIDTLGHNLIENILSLNTSIKLVENKEVLQKKVDKLQEAHDELYELSDDEEIETVRSILQKKYLELEDVIELIEITCSFSYGYTLLREMKEDLDFKNNN